ncbi:MAG: DUF883 C-terminal domain-containing protein [Bacteriovoracaceae bacterium]|jgi:ElaB/YqjD/DUF883 family membrane-anchored ribosome-binding protein|nr:DUF883 C-terminal domain-containing protein [Bacteriovoracaceae bacterium]
MENDVNLVQKLREEHKSNLEELEKSFAEKKVELTQLIQKYPLTSVAVAAGIGFLIGKIFSQKR